MSKVYKIKYDTEKKPKQYMTHPEKRMTVLYTSSKNVSLIMAFLFFLSYFCISASFYDNYFVLVFLPFYI